MCYSNDEIKLLSLKMCCSNDEIICCGIGQMKVSSSGSKCRIAAKNVTKSADKKRLNYPLGFAFENCISLNLFSFELEMYSLRVMVVKSKIGAIRDHLCGQRHKEHNQAIQTSWTKPQLRFLETAH